MLSRIAVLLIRAYQILISPYIGRHCRFYPTCSSYAAAVYQEWGFVKGTVLTVKRLLKCGAWNPGGYDPPPKKSREVKQ
ncbi:MAG: membrane protein insertion efficiency factor YidD [Synergistaceae bacterium]|nr:membrane protein insertion efficiency factor YidD [Synergistaceae bacterium]